MIWANVVSADRLNPSTFVKSVQNKASAEGGPLAAEGEEIAAEAVQDAILGHTSQKNRCQSVVMTTRNC